MKIKQDFITNSSSTSFVICLPKDFDILKFLEENKENISDELEDNEITFDQFKSSIDDLIKSKIFYLCDNEDSFYIIEELFKNFIISSVDCDSSSGTATLIYLEDIIKQIKDSSINKYSKSEKYIPPLGTFKNNPYGD
jgi:hypothetical protein